MNKQTEAMKRALVDEDGENRAVRWFLAAYRNPGMSVGGMKAHLKLSGYPLWPDWVERCHPSEHLTKAGAQLWIRHLFSLEATPPAAPVQEPGPSGDYLSDFQEGQWWLAELDAAVANGTHDQKRAVAVVRNLLATVAANTTPPAAPVQEPVANGLANQIETSGSPVMVQFPRHTSVLADDWTIDPAFLLRVKHTIAPDHPAEFTPSMEEIETTLLALECIPTHIYTTPPAAPVQEPNIGALGMPVNVPVTPAGSAEAFCSQEIQDLTSLGARLALELECLLLESKDTAAISKWWDTAHEALADWHDHLWQVSHGDNYVSPLGKD